MQIGKLTYRSLWYAYVYVVCSQTIPYSITVSYARKLTSVSMRYSQGDGFDISLSRSMYCTHELFNDWRGRGSDDSVPGEVTKTAPSGDRTTGSPTWSASLPRIQLIPPGSWSDMSPVGAIFVPSPPNTGTILLHPLSPPIIGRVPRVVPFLVPFLAVLLVVCGYLSWHGYVLPGTRVIKIMCVHQLYQQG